MTLAIEIRTLEASLKAAGLQVDPILKIAEVDRSTWTRWKSGAVKGARYDTFARVRTAADAALASAKRGEAA